jgi:hypothetical protein
MDERLYRKVRTVIDIYLLVGIPLGVGIVINYVLGIGVLGIIATVTIWRRRFVDERFQELIIEASPRGKRRSEPTGRLSKPGEIMALSALVTTCLIAGRMIVDLYVGRPFPWVPASCLLIVWVGVGIVALSHYLRQRSR